MACLLWARNSGAALLGAQWLRRGQCGLSGGSSHQGACLEPEALLSGWPTHRAGKSVLWLVGGLGSSVQAAAMLASPQRKRSQRREEVAMP